MMTASDTNSSRSSLNDDGGQHHCRRRAMNDAVATSAAANKTKPTTATTSVTTSSTTSDDDARTMTMTNSSSSSTTTTTATTTKKKKGGSAGPTPADEIARQHARAVAVVRRCLERRGRQQHSEEHQQQQRQQQQQHGEIPLSQKQCPTCELVSSQQDDQQQYTKYYAWSSRGRIDVTALQALFREGYDQKYEKDANNNSNDNNNRTKVGSGDNDTPIQSLTNLWDPHIARINNVAMRRPSHDDWGINKVAFVFADDFLLRKYELPWWSGDVGGIRSRLLQPLLEDVLQIEQRQIVRLLLTSLPPATTIPEHHDTGEWVKHTHRIHIPIIVEDPAQVVFTCRLQSLSTTSTSSTTADHDATAETATAVVTDRDVVMDHDDDPDQDDREVMFDDTDDHSRIDCTPGHVFEINNQAKHAVSNCHATQYRVHLILDYVDRDHPLASAVGVASTATAAATESAQHQQHNNSAVDTPPSPSRLLPTHTTIQVAAGETLIQSRRSIDLLSNKGSRPTPSFLILGAQKAGTTSLFELIMQHPLTVRPKNQRRETHCFDWRWQSSSDENDVSSCDDEDDLLSPSAIQKQRHHCHSFFHTEQLAYYPSCLTGDSTPSYLLDSVRVIPRLRRIFDWPLRFFVCLRHPVRRAESHYAMVTDPAGTPAQLKTRGSEWRQKSFKDVVMMELQQMKECGLIPYWDIELGVCDMSTFDRFHNSAEENQAWEAYLRRHVPLNTGSHSLLARGMYELQLRPWFAAYDRDDFLILILEQITMTSNSGGGADENSSGGFRDRVIQQVWDHLHLPPISLPSAKTATVSTDRIENTPRNTRQYESPIDDHAGLRDYLHRFYAPHNRQLASRVLKNAAVDEQHDGGKDWCNKIWGFPTADVPSSS